MKKIALGLFVAALALVMIVPAAMAQKEFKPYMSVRLLTFYHDMEYDKDTDTGGDTLNNEDKEELFWSDNYARTGAHWATGDLTGRLELGLYGQDAVLRLAYAEWDFGSGVLMVGQNYTPYFFPSAQVCRDLVGIHWGAMYDGRQPYIKLTLPAGPASVYFALMETETGDVVASTTTAYGGSPLDDVTTNADVEKVLPKMNVGIDYATDLYSLGAGFAYNTYNEQYDNHPTLGNWDEDIDSYLLYVNGKVASGPAEFKASIHYAQNLGNFGITYAGIDNEFAALDEDGTGVADAESWGFLVNLALEASPTTKVNIGGGWATCKRDDVAAPNDDDDTQATYYVNVPVKMADSFHFIPEFSYFDMMDNDQGEDDDTDEYYIGVKWQLDL